MPRLQVKKRLLLHIGYPKTATTLLQESLFATHPDLFQIKDNWTEKGFTRNIIFQHRIPFERDLPLYQKQVKSELQNAGNRTVILSSESIMSMSTFFRFEPHPWIWCPDPYTVAEKLHRVFSDVNAEPQVILVVRRQTDWLRSQYAQAYNLVYKRFRCTRTFERFIDHTLGEGFDNSLGVAIDYQAIVACYDKFFGKENVSVIPYEWTKSAPERFSQTWAKLLDIDTNSIQEIVTQKKANQKQSTDGSYSTDSRSLLETLTQWKKRTFGQQPILSASSSVAQFLSNTSLPARRIKQMDFKPEQRVKLNDRYVKSNQQLSKRINLNLEGLGYYDLK